MVLRRKTWRSEVFMTWIESVDTGYGVISSFCRRVVVGGFSAGGGLALEFAARMRSFPAFFPFVPLCACEIPYRGWLPEWMRSIDPYGE